MSKPVYIIGTGLSHNGSCVLLKDGYVHTAIEKERLSRKKHDGGNDTLAIQYCLNTAGITLKDIDLVVQSENFVYPDRNNFGGPRLFAQYQALPVINISHHLAHAYSAAGTCPFEESHILVVDGCGSPFEQVIDKPENAIITPNINDLARSNLVCEKDSFYYFDGSKVTPLCKDFSATGLAAPMPTTQHSIGGFYAAVSHHVFGDMSDVGKLMGLAPFGDPTQITQTAFLFEGDRLLMHPQWSRPLVRPASDHHDMRQHFEYYANIAAWAQANVTDAVLTLVKKRMRGRKNKTLCYSGGVALNIVANSKLLTNRVVDSLYVEPAAGDNGLALGCAFYGWLEYFNKPAIPHNKGTCFGRKYQQTDIVAALTNPAVADAIKYTLKSEPEMLSECADMLSEGQVVGWFQGGSEFGPRALGHRSILAHPGIPSLHRHINNNIKKREDFRPFAPSLLESDVSTYFENGSVNPYMLSVDFTRPQYKDKLHNVTHRDNSARIQTVNHQQDPKFAQLLQAFKNITGFSVLLNTSLNQRGQPIVETPEEAIGLLLNSALDALVMENYIIRKQSTGQN